MPLYFISLLPPNELSERIEILKMEMAKKFECKRALRLPAHITLQIPFKLEEDKEEKLLNSLDDFSKKTMPFEIRLQDYGHFSNSTIYIGVEENEQLQQLYFNLKDHLHRNFPVKNAKESGKFRPHITLATRDISPQNFSKAWQQLKEQEFSAKFLAQVLVLLKHNGKTWDLLKSFKFAPVSNAQN